MWWLYLLAPALALLPKRWRRRLPFHDAVPWHFASLASGIAESGLALFALLLWYSYSVTTWVSRLLENAMPKAGPVEITDHEIGFAALLVVATHPLTWLIAYFALEGAVRLCAAFTDTVLGVLPLYVVERLYAKIRGYQDPQPPGTPHFAQSNVSSYVNTLKEKLTTERLPHLPDEVSVSTAGSEEILEIHSSHAKPEWDPPRVVRCDDRYYRLEEAFRGPAPRPFIYRLRRLSAGVPGRTVIVYQLPETSPAANE